jgi:dihydroorotate dehydrogenase electron transfer subunit
MSELSTPRNDLARPRQMSAEILEHREVAPLHFKMRIRVGEVAGSIKAGQFLHVLPRGGGVRDPLLRRAFSIMSTSGDSVELLYKVMGLGTAWLSHLAVGDSVNVILPLGHPFAALPARAVLVGGGVGVPPMVMLASTHTATTEKLEAIVGARTRHDLIGVSEFAAMGITAEVSTDDGSAGHHGRVTDLLEARLQSATDAMPTVYSCGPFLMLRAVAALCERYAAPCQVSLEENMPCGVGICNGCVVPVIGAGDDYGRYRRICVEGPVVWAHEIDWAHLSAAAACH